MSTNTKIKDLSRKGLNMKAKNDVRSALLEKVIGIDIQDGPKNTLIVNDKVKLIIRAKREDEWPSVTGIWKQNQIIVFVDYQNYISKPDFYIVNLKNWIPLIEKETENYYNKSRDKYRNKYTIDDKNTPIWINKIQKNGKPRKGRNFKAIYVKEFLNKWSFIQELI